MLPDAGSPSRNDANDWPIEFGAAVELSSGPRVHVESKLNCPVWLLAKMIEEFGLDYDATAIDQSRKQVEIREADGKNDALHVLKWKELYDHIEKAIDNCEDVGHTLERIVLKNG